MDAHFQTFVYVDGMSLIIKFDGKFDSFAALCSEADQEAG